MDPFDWPYAIASAAFLLLDLVAITLAIVFRKGAPTVCLLVAVGSVLFLIGNVGGVFVYLSSAPLAAAGSYTIFVSAVYLNNFTASILWLIAIFTGRSPKPPFNEWDF